MTTDKTPGAAAREAANDWYDGVKAGAAWQQAQDNERIEALRAALIEASAMLARLTELISDGHRNWASDNITGPCQTNIREALARAAELEAGGTT